MKFNKKASMQLSINMIVILIIAVVILGLALGFVKGMFRNVEKTFIGEAGSEPDAPGATPGEPITMSRAGQIIASPGEELTVNWGFFCNLDADCTASLSDVTTEIVCTPAIFSSVTSTSRTIESGFADQIVSMMTVEKTQAETTALCTIEKFDNKKDFTVKIMK